MFNIELDELPVVVGVFEDDGEGMDPRFRAETLWDSVKDDWPGWDVRYFMNDEAAALAEQRRMWAIGMNDDSDVMPARIEAHNAEVERARRARLRAAREKQ